MKLLIQMTLILVKHLNLYLVWITCRIRVKDEVTLTIADKFCLLPQLSLLSTELQAYLLKILNKSPLSSILSCLRTIMRETFKRQKDDNTLRISSSILFNLHICFSLVIDTGITQTLTALSLVV